MHAAAAAFAALRGGHSTPHFFVFLYCHPERSAAQSKDLLLFLAGQLNHQTVRPKSEFAEMGFPKPKRQPEFPYFDLLRCAILDRNHHKINTIMTTIARVDRVADENCGKNLNDLQPTRSCIHFLDLRAIPKKMRIYT